MYRLLWRKIRVIGLHVSIFMAQWSHGEEYCGIWAHTYFFVATITPLEFHTFFAEQLGDYCSSSCLAMYKCKSRQGLMLPSYRFEVTYPQIIQETGVHAGRRVGELVILRKRFRSTMERVATSIFRDAQA